MRVIHAPIATRRNAGATDSWMTRVMSVRGVSMKVSTDCAG